MEPTKRKTLLTVAIVLSGSFLAVLLSSTSTVTAYQSTGIAIDFGDRNVTWTDADLNLYGDPIKALEYACSENRYSLVEDGGTVKEINGVTNTAERKWGLWAVTPGSLNWVRLDMPYDNIAKYSVAAWAYCGDGEEPAVGVDQYGRCIYGYPQADRVVSLSPSITEIVGALNAVNVLVGTDRYSNYPSSVVEGQNRGDIQMVGDYVTPSFELIMKTDPGVVFCDGSQYSHYEMAERIRKTTVNSIVLYVGQSTETIQDNVYIIGVVMGYELRSLEVISQLQDAETEIVRSIGSGGSLPIDTMAALSPDKSPWVSGSGTYMNDVLLTMMGTNVFSSKYGWVQVNSESIPKADPDVIIIITDQYYAAESEYRILLDNLSAEWKSTEAYKTGRIYVMCEDLAEMAQRAGPRYAQLMEIVSLILHFPSEIPMYIGNDYRDYLKITGYLGFE